MGHVSVNGLARFDLATRPLFSFHPTILRPPIRRQKNLNLLFVESPIQILVALVLLLFISRERVYRLFESDFPVVLATLALRSRVEISSHFFWLCERQ